MIYSPLKTRLVKNPDVCVSVADAIIIDVATVVKLLNPGVSTGHIYNCVLKSPAPNNHENQREGATHRYEICSEDRYRGSGHNLRPEL